MIIVYKSTKRGVQMCFFKKKAKERIVKSLNYDKPFIMINFKTYKESTGENALKLAYLRSKRVLSLSNEQCSSMKVLSLETGFHGRTLGALSATHSNSGYKEGYPSFPWLKLPVGNPETTVKTLKKYLASGQIAACILEPIQAEGGDVHLDPALARDIRRLLWISGVPLIVDEVQTGVGGTGKMWAHEWWELEKHNLAPPEFVTVSKKSQQAGIFFFEEDLPARYYQIFNTWLGNPWDLAKFETILDTIHEDKLLDRVQETGEYLQSELNNIGGPISNIRGKGTMVAFDIHEPFKNHQLLRRLELNGAIVGTCGENSIRLRPPLTADKDDVSLFIIILRKSLDGCFGFRDDPKQSSQNS